MFGWMSIVRSAVCTEVSYENLKNAVHSPVALCTKMISTRLEGASNDVVKCVVRSAEYLRGGSAHLVAIKSESPTRIVDWLNYHIYNNIRQYWKVGVTGFDLRMDKSKVLQITSKVILVRELMNVYA